MLESMLERASQPLEPLAPPAGMAVAFAWPEGLPRLPLYLLFLAEGGGMPPHGCCRAADRLGPLLRGKGKARWPRRGVARRGALP